MSRSTLKVVLLAPKSTTATVRSRPPSGIWWRIRAQAFSNAKASTSTRCAVSPEACTAAWRCSTFSVRVATSSTSSISGILLRRSHDLIVVADFFHREGNVLVGLHLDLAFQFVLAEILRHLNHFRDRRVAADRDGREAALGAGALHRAPNRFADRFRVDDGFFVDGVMRSRFRRIRLNAILATRHRELDELHRRGGYVKSQKRTISFA